MGQIHYHVTLFREWLPPLKHYVGRVFFLFSVLVNFVHINDFTTAKIVFWICVLCHKLLKAGVKNRIVPIFFLQNFLELNVVFIAFDQFMTEFCP